MAPTIFDRVYGTAFVGTFISSLLLGVISVQTYLYFQRYGKDPLATKIVVGLLWAMQAMQVAVSTRAIYHYLISSLLDPWALAVQTWEFSYYGTHLVLTSAIVQTFFLYRLWSISRQRVLVVVNGILILGSLTMGFISAVRSYLYQLSTNTHAHESWSVNAWLGLAALADTSIAVSLVIVLRSQRTGYKYSDTVLNYIILYGITTGALTSLVAVVLLICYAGRNLFESLLLLGIPLGGLYIAALLANLHTRSTLRARMEREKERQAAAFELQPSPPTSILPSSSTVYPTPSVDRPPVSRSTNVQGSLPPTSVSGLSFPRVWPFLHRGTESIHPKDTTDKSSAETTSTAVSAAKRASHGSWVASPSKAKRQTMTSEATAVESSNGIDGGRDSVIIIGPNVGATAFTPARRELPPIPHPIVGNGTPPQRHYFAAPPLDHPELNPYPTLFTTNPNVLSQGQDSNIPPYPYLPPFPRGDGFF